MCPTSVLFLNRVKIMRNLYALMAELADALDSGSSDRKVVEVQVLLGAPKQYNPNHVVCIGEGYGFIVFL